MRKRRTLATPMNSFSRKFDLANTNKRSSFLMVENIQSTLSQVTDKAASTRIQMKIRRLQKCPDS